MDKAPDAYRTISEVGEDLDIAQHVLRFWETRFPQIKPLKRGGGRRYYRPDDVELLKGIRHLLYREGYTIKGVQRILKEQGPRGVQDVGRAGGLVPGLAPPQPDEFEPLLRAPAPPSSPAPVAREPVPRAVAGFGEVPKQASIEPEQRPQSLELPFDLPPAPRPPQGQVSFTRGGIGALGETPSPPVQAASTPSSNPMRLALFEALGELESARAAIGRVLAGREEISGQ